MLWCVLSCLLTNIYIYNKKHNSHGWRTTVFLGNVWLRIVWCVESQRCAWKSSSDIERMEQPVMGVGEEHGFCIYSHTKSGASYKMHVLWDVPLLVARPAAICSLVWSQHVRPMYELRTKHLIPAKCMLYLYLWLLYRSIWKEKPSHTCVWVSRATLNTLNTLTRRIPTSPPFQLSGFWLIMVGTFSKHFTPSHTSTTTVRMSSVNRPNSAS